MYRIARACFEKDSLGRYGCLHPGGWLSNNGERQGKTAVITCGTEGIGLATAKLFVKEGAYVFITSRRKKELDEAVKAIGTNVSGVQGDVAQLADLDRLYQTVSR